MSWLVLPLLAACLLVAAVMYRGRTSDRQCRNCHTDYELISAAGQGPNQTYDVLACPFCSATVTRVQGIPSSDAWCPACRNRSLHTTSMRVAGDNLRVEVHEHCESCEFERTYQVGEGEVRPLAKVIPFPIDRTRRPPPIERSGSNEPGTGQGQG